MQRAVAELRARHRAAIAALPRELRVVHARRQSRLAAGIAGCAGAAVMWIAALSPGGHGATLALWLSVAAAGIAAWFGKTLSGRMLDSALSRPLRATDDVFGDFDRMRAYDPQRAAIDLACRAGLGSARWLALAVAMLGPLCCHFVCGVLITDGDLIETPGDFDHWVWMTARILPHAYAFTIGLLLCKPERWGLTLPIGAGALAAVPWIVPGVIVVITGLLVYVLGIVPLVKALHNERMQLTHLQNDHARSVS